MAIGAMAVPQAIAFAMLAGFPIAAGLYGSAILPIVVGALSGRAASVSATAGATAAIIQHITDDSGPLQHITKDDRIQFLAPVLLLCAAIELMCGVFGASRMLRLIPHTAMMGFLNALSIIIGISQWDVFRFCPNRRFDVCSSSELKWLSLDTLECWLTILHVLMAMAIVTFLPRIPRYGKLIPASFAAVVLSLALEGIYRACGAQTRNIGETSDLSRSLPSWNSPVLPASASGEVGLLIQYAVTLAVVGLIESLLTVQIMCRTLGEESTALAGNIECAAQAAGNLVSSCFGAMGGCCIVGPSMVNILNGARGRLSTIVSGIFMFLVIAVAGPAIDQVPVASLAGILLAMCINIFDWSSFRLLRSFFRVGISIDLVILIVVSVLGVTWNLAFAVLVGCALAALEFAYKSAATMKVEEKIESATTENIVNDQNRTSTSVINESEVDLASNDSSSPALASTSIRSDAPLSKTYILSGPISFASCSDLRRMLTMASDPPHVCIDFTAARLLDHSSLTAVAELVVAYQQSGRRVTARGFHDAAAHVAGGHWQTAFSGVQFDAHDDDDEYEEEEEYDPIHGPAYGISAPTQLHHHPHIGGSVAAVDIDDRASMRDPTRHGYTGVDVAGERHDSDKRALVRAVLSTRAAGALKASEVAESTLSDANAVVAQYTP